MRLSELDAEKVADEAHTAVVGHAHRLAFASGFELREGAGVSDVRLAVHQLCVYAQCGVYPEHRRELLGEYQQSVAEALYTSATHYEVQDLDREADPSTPWGLVLRAGRARELIEEGEPVPADWLATLASVDAGYVRQLLSSGELRANRKRGPYRRLYVSAAEARRWLTARRCGRWRAPSA